MTRYFCFLRAINVGGHTVTMQKLKQLFESMGFANVETFIASGNVIFESKLSPGAAEKLIFSSLNKALGYDVHAFLRSREELVARKVSRESRAFARSSTICAAKEEKSSG